ncbi:hypothetical protein ACLKA6_002853 [Drosophila palustris]
MKNNKLIINNNQAEEEAAHNTRPAVRGVTSANYRQQAKTVAYNYAATRRQQQQQQQQQNSQSQLQSAAKPAEGALRTS